MVSRYSYLGNQNLGYRYSFNGKENDADVKGDGNQIDYGMRVYDPRLGKFLSLDPITKKYPELTPYQFASNRPIQGIDLDGLEFWEAQLAYEMFAAPFINFGQAGVSYYDNTVKKITAESGNANYQSDGVKISPVERDQLARKDILEATAGQFKAATKMYVATAEVVSTLVPAGTDAVLAERAISKVPAAGRYVIKAVTSEKPRPFGFANWGSETFDDAIRTTEQAFEIRRPQTVSPNTSETILNTSRQLQAKFKHATDFGVTGNYNKINAGKFSSVINQHINSPDVKVIFGSYRGQSVIHYLNPKTGLDVISSRSGNFISGWKLNPAQLQNVIKHGGL